MNLKIAEAHSSQRNMVVLYIDFLISANLSNSCCRRAANDRLGWTERRKLFGEGRIGDGSTGRWAWGTMIWGWWMGEGVGGWIGAGAGACGTWTGGGAPARSSNWPWMYLKEKQNWISEDWKILLDHGIEDGDERRRAESMSAQREVGKWVGVRLRAWGRDDRHSISRHDSKKFVHDSPEDAKIRSSFSPKYYMVPIRSSLLAWRSLPSSLCCLTTVSASSLAGNSVSQRNVKSLAKWRASPERKLLLTFFLFCQNPSWKLVTCAFHVLGWQPQLEILRIFRWCVSVCLWREGRENFPIFRWFRYFKEGGSEKLLCLCLVARWSARRRYDARNSEVNREVGRESDGQENQLPKGRKRRGANQCSQQRTMSEGLSILTPGRNRSRHIGYFPPTLSISDTLIRLQHCKESRTNYPCPRHFY